MFENPIMDMTAASIALIIIWVGAFIVILKLKKKLDPRVKRDYSFEGMSIEHLEKIHGSGMISDEEFTKMRRALLGLPPVNDEKSKKVQPSGGSFDIMENSDKTDNNNGAENNNHV